jgi:uncharacterized protein (TIGR00725 family)
MQMIIGVIGGRSVNCQDQAIRLAYAVGAEIGRRGLALVCGGGDGIMEAACKGCKETGGATLGIFKWNHSEDANPFIDYAIATSMDLARNNIIVWTAAGLIAFDGMYGTASEASLSLDVGRPLVVTGNSPLFKTDAYNTPSCKYIPGNDPANAATVLDTLLDIIRRSELLKDARNV